MKRDAALSFIRHRGTMVRTFNGQFYVPINGSWYRNVSNQDRIALSKYSKHLRWRRTHDRQTEKSNPTDSTLREILLAFGIF